MCNKKTKRDFGLDSIRCLALFLMIFAHYPLPDAVDTQPWIKLLAGSAPVIFFFGFGMTIHRLLQKSKKVQLEQTFLFILLAVSLNMAFVQKIVYMEFFMFLAIVQALIVFSGILSIKLLWFSLIGTLTSCFYFVFENYSFISSQNLHQYYGYLPSVGGNFPLLPWLIFVVMGCLYNFLPKTNPVNNTIFSGAVVVLFTLAVLDVEFIKKPLNLAYCLGFIAFSIVMYFVSRKYNYRESSFIYRSVNFYSKNLLLCTCMHYVAIMVVRVITENIWGQGWLVFSERSPLLALMAPLSAFFVLPVIVRLVMLSWLLLSTSCTKLSAFIDRQKIVVSVALVSGLCLYDLVLHPNSTIMYMLGLAVMLVIALLMQLPKVKAA